MSKNENKLTRGCEKWSEQNILNNSASWVLNDGSILLFYGDKPNFSLFALDVNGKMGPNKWGHDLFPLYLKSVDSKRAGSLLEKCSNNIFLCATI